MYFRLSSIVMTVFPLIVVYAIYEVIRFIITNNHATLHSAVSALLLGLFVDAVGRLILTPLWHKSLAEVDFELGKAEEELRLPASSLIGVARGL
jgi:hypothetical protein